MGTWGLPWFSQGLLEGRVGTLCQEVDLCLLRPSHVYEMAAGSILQMSRGRLSEVSYHRLGM